MRLQQQVLQPLPVLDLDGDGRPRPVEPDRLPRRALGAGPALLAGRLLRLWVGVRPLLPLTAVDGASGRAPVGRVRLVAIAATSSQFAFDDDLATLAFL